ncbi:ModD protein [Citrobacter sp. HN-141]|uniref:ModD protein n=1 Tax=unclassified Citrobacter TaxID=2644389 RepID=UPI002964987F|nr:MULTISPECIES: ModD protein [unclassified Citrobacter]MDW2645627.1 ModD protein [Citrobacter sp. HN-141]MDW2655177.1 ModD protein [Citrobacter sp. HN-120]MDW2698202.1 ModD protein [Citrobacter sp. HN-144]
MIYVSQAQVDALLLEDIQGGDLTTRALGIGEQPGNMDFYHRQGGCVSGTAVARQMLTSLGLTVTDLVPDGERANTGQLLLRAHGNAAALHQGWKAVQNVLEWSCGVSRYLDEMLNELRQRYPDGQIACTRKAIPGTRLLATQAILAAGGIIHRGGCAETVLLFANHRRFLADPHDWAAAIAQLRAHAPEKKIVVEADTPNEALAALHAAPDVLQLDKFTPEQAADIARLAPSLAPHCTLALTGGITLASLASYLDCGIRLFITSAPYYAPPADIKVSLSPDARGI